MAGDRGEGEGGGEEGLELLLPQLDGERACQGVEQTWLARDLQQNNFSIETQLLPLPLSDRGELSDQRDNAWDTGMGALLIKGQDQP